MPVQVPNGKIDDLLEVYDRDRSVLPAPVAVWEWGFTKSAETWNGRFASTILVDILNFGSLPRYCGIC